MTEAAAIWQALGINAMDLLAAPGGQLDSVALAHDPLGTAQRVRQTGMALSNLLYLFGADFHDHALNSPETAIQAKNWEVGQRVIEFCAAAGIPSLLVLPGMDHPGRSHTEALQRSAEALNRLAELAQTAKVQLLFEPHKESLLEAPGEALTFIQHNPALQLVLDYSHFVAQGYPAAEIEPLAPYAGHVHLRQAAPGRLQAEWSAGTIDFPRIIARLKEVGYAGYVALEYEHDPWLELVDVMTESILMRDCVRPLLGSST